MKVTFFATAALAALVAAQSIEDRVNELETCERECLQNALTEVGCGESDVECACGDGNLDNVAGALASCAVDFPNACITDDAAQLLGRVCGGEIVDEVSSRIDAAQSSASDFIDSLSTRFDDFTSSLTTPTSDDHAPRETGLAWVGAAAAIAAMAL